MHTQIITAEELAKLMGEGSALVLIDLRKDPDYAADPRLLPGAVKRSLSEIDVWGKTLPQDRPIVVYCDEGKWVGATAVERLRAQGREVRQMEGGFRAWRAAGLRLEERGKRP
ncbi:MAG TPA: thiosulfate sulfurtransferase GlpE [Alphaproteobacteria bacterium]|nr:thiosulfate sulfurtransferase GlpE [Alphaproteobacteria bacterium]